MILFRRKSWQEKEEKMGRGVLMPLETKHYVMVKVGRMYTSFDQRYNGPLTNDFREAICYQKRRPSDWISPYHSLEKAEQDAKTYGGKVVHVTVTIEEYV